MKIIQITDMHLYQNPSTKWRDKINTHESFNKVLQHAIKFENPDMLLLTGDLSEDGSIESYQRLASIIDNTNIESYCIPGNHDSTSIMKQVLPSRFLSFQRNISFKRWEIIFIDSTVVNAHHGNLSNNELEQLNITLNQYSDKHILIAIHHNPVPCSSPVLDAYGLKNSEDFFNIINNYNNIKLVLYGHIHQEYTSQINNVAFLACPASCIQFLPKAIEFTLDKLPPGYRWIQLHENGGFDTGVRYL